MNDDELVQTQDPALELPPDIEPLPDPEPTAPPMEVVPVDDFLDRLTELLGYADKAPEGSEEFDELPAEDPEEALQAIDGLEDLPVVDPDPMAILVEQIAGRLLDMIVDLGKIEEHTKEIEKDTNEIQLDVMRVAAAVDHPALTTPFEDYTVSEALLLLLLLFAFVSACARMLRGGLSWLRS